jgi:hypothetical protein
VLEQTLEQALEHIQEFKRRWRAVPPFDNKVNKATREAISGAHSPIFQAEESIRQALEAEQQERRNQCGETCERAKLCATCARGLEAEQQELERAEPVQAEPVAWMTRFDNPERGSYGKPADTHLKRDEAEGQVQRHIYKRLCKLRIDPLYAVPVPTQPGEETDWEHIARLLDAALQELVVFVDERWGDNECRPLENAKHALGLIKEQW